MYAVKESKKICTGVSTKVLQKEQKTVFAIQIYMVFY